MISMIFQRSNKKNHVGFFIQISKNRKWSVILSSLRRSGFSLIFHSLGRVCTYNNNSEV